LILREALAAGLGSHGSTAGKDARRHLARHFQLHASQTEGFRISTAAIPRFKVFLRGGQP
jgi:hypothetical protein